MVDLSGYEQRHLAAHMREAGMPDLDELLAEAFGAEPSGPAITAMKKYQALHRKPPERATEGIRSNWEGVFAVVLFLVIAAAVVFPVILAIMR